jgi:hypothetical protein
MLMHRFTELVNRCANFALSTLKEVNDKTIDALQTSGATSLVKTLQMVQLQKAILAVGIFSLFEAALRDGLNCDDGFEEVDKILDDERQNALKEEFADYQKAINVLKHGRGRSYDALVAKSANLPFKIKLPTDAFFNEGDVSEIATLIEIDDKFVLECARIIQEVSEVVRKARQAAERRQPWQARE